MERVTPPDQPGGLSQQTNGPQAKAPTPKPTAGHSGFAQLFNWLNLNVWFVIAFVLVAFGIYQLIPLSIILGIGAALYWHFNQRPKLREVAAEAARGWHADPLETHAWRWWDGERWTDHTDGKSEKPDTNPIGWHADPLGTHAWRWWNGSSWTDHFSDAPAPPNIDPRG